jgi:hypothetical protein
MIFAVPSLLDDKSSYRRLIAPLVELAVSQFHLSRKDAQLVAHEVLMAHVRYLEVDHIETRLLAAMRIALRARHTQ